MDDIDEIIQEFLVESHENLDQLDADLVALEQDPGSRHLLASVFRTIHTIKGTSGFLGFGQLESVTHVGESLLSMLRDGVLVLDPEMTSALLRLVDAVRELLAGIEATGAELPGDHVELLATLTQLQTRKAPEAPPVALLGELLVERHLAEPHDVTLALVAQDTGDDRRLGEILVDHGVLDSTDVSDALETQGEGRRSAADSTIRVDVGLLDSLMNLVGELVLTRNQIVQKASARQDTDLLRTTHRLNLIAGELQEGVMKTRMQPIDTVWSKLPRVVRDLSTNLGKPIRVRMEGRETELDKTILEAVKDPLTHLVRNSVDHGIEPTDVRLAAGKPAEGTLLLRAFHEGGQVNIVISDDGAGIDPVRIRTKAVERGLLSESAAERLSERETLNLIFVAGFSTAQTVTNVSGRGVGMDVVKTNIERIGGLIDVTSTVGVGTTFRIKIPLTLAIIPALVIAAAGQQYAIPQVNLLELVRLGPDDDTRRIERIHGTPVLRLREKLLPLVSLREQLQLPAEQSDATYIVVLQAGERQFGLVVDDINDTEEIVVKPLGKQLRGVALFAGATIMGDGGVALILDAVALAQRAGILAHDGPDGVLDTSESTDGDRTTLLLVSLSDGRQVALPLRHVDRLEEFAASVVERVGSQEVVQYRDQILPLVRLDSVYGAYSDGEPPASTQVVVCTHGAQLVGFVVHAIVDIVDATLSVASSIDTGGRLGSAVVNGKVTELVDVAHAVGGLLDVLLLTEA